MKIYLRADYLNMIRWWVDASCGTHWDCKSHTGALISMGAGAIMSFSRKQKLDTGSSTEAELLGIYDSLGLIICTKYFMEAQGCSIDSNIMFQYNQSTILLANNGRSLAGKNSKQTENSYFLIADKAH